jgi:hypothetical protein
MHTLIGMPQGAEWLIILGMVAVMVVSTLALIVWLIVHIVRH